MADDLQTLFGIPNPDQAQWTAWLVGEQTSCAGVIIKLGGARAIVRRHGLGVLQRAAGF
jgi:hypothetical protein